MRQNLRPQQKTPQPRLDPVLKKRIAVWLKDAPHGRMSETALMLGVSTRTLRNWKKTLGDSRPMGRPRTQITFNEILLISKEWKRQGFRGSRSVIEALPNLRVRLIRKIISELKKRRRLKRARFFSKHRISIRKIAPATFHTLDATYLTKNQLLLVGKDRGSQMISANPIVGKFNSESTIKYLENLRTKNQLPLVLSTDNGAQFCSKLVNDYLEKNKIIHLKSLPHTPQHNGSAEIGIRELKETMVDTKSLETALNALNTRFRRRVLGYKTAAEVHLHGVSDIFDNRDQFYGITKDAIKARTSGLRSARDVRKAEREAVLDVMESFKLITINRGP